MADAFSFSWGGAVHELHGHLDWAARQLFPDTADREDLLRQASLYGITPIPATFATGDVTVTGIDGNSVPIDTILQLDADISYRVTVGATIASGTATITVQAVLAGSASNAVAGVALSFESPITGVDASATVATGGIEDGENEEPTDGTRARLILHLQEPPEGGADQDYKEWTLEVAGVSRAFVYPNENGLGTVVVRFMMRDPLDENAEVFPGVPDVAAVQAKLQAERPITAEVTAAAPTSLAVAFSIGITPDTPEVRAAVSAELTDLLFREAEPGDITTTRGTILLSHIRTAIGVAAGVTDYTITVPAADVVPSLGQLPVLGVITWL